MQSRIEPLWVRRDSCIRFHWLYRLPDLKVPTLKDRCLLIHIIYTLWAHLLWNLLPIARNPINSPEEIQMDLDWRTVDCFCGSACGVPHRELELRLARRRSNRPSYVYA